MTAMSTTPRLVLADLLPGTRVRDAVLIAGGAGLTGLAAQVSVHTSLTPVPFTLGTLAVLFVGATLGTVRGVLSLSLYLLAGMAGVPWYSNQGSGWDFPAFGYIVGYVVAAGIVGELARRGNDRTITSTIGLMVLGSAVIYVFGATWLAYDLHWSASHAVDKGVTPFLIGDAVKAAIAAVILPTAWKLVRR
ncbi:MAG: biotin transporter BioY [Pseudonocardiales bacterium]|nr:biotin transporter BioY [Pseudonocardiales bacterium]